MSRARPSPRRAFPTAMVAGLEAPHVVHLDLDLSGREPAERSHILNERQIAPENSVQRKRQLRRSAL